MLSKADAIERKDNYANLINQIKIQRKRIPVAGGKGKGVVYEKVCQRISKVLFVPLKEYCKTRNICMTKNAAAGIADSFLTGIMGHEDKEIFKEIFGSKNDTEQQALEYIKQAYSEKVTTISKSRLTQEASKYFSKKE